MTTRRSPVWRSRVGEVVAFGAVGTAAFVVHFTVVSVLVPRGIGPLVANVAAFATAFAVSFVGHAKWSFPAAGRPVGPALGKFATVAIAGFVMNEAAYAVLLRWTGLDYRVALVVVLLGVAAATFAASRQWAFATRPGGEPPASSGSDPPPGTERIA